MDDVFPEGVVLCLDGFVVALESVKLADLLLELFYVAFFALTKGALM